MMKLIYGQRIYGLPVVKQAGKFNEQYSLGAHCELICALLQRWEFFSIDER